MTTSGGRIIVRTVDIEKDYEAVAKGFKEWYWPCEPLSTGFHIKNPSPLEQERFPQLLHSGMSVVAEYHDDNKNISQIVGFLVNAPNHPELSAEYKKELQENPDERLSAFLGIMSQLEKRLNIFEKYEVEKCFQLFFVAVNPQYRGKLIGNRLFEESFKIGKNLGYKIAATDCTSIYSQRIARQLKMDDVATVKYSDYKNAENEQVFKPAPEHTHITKFVKMLD